jgi:hypothetical protein
LKKLVLDEVYLHGEWDHVLSRIADAFSLEYFKLSEKQLPERRRGEFKLSSHSILRGSCDAEVANVVIGVLAGRSTSVPHTGETGGLGDGCFGFVRWKVCLADLGDFPVETPCFGRNM